MPPVRLAPRPWPALVVSGLIHLVFGAVLVLASATPGCPTSASRSTSPGERWFGSQQLRGADRKRLAGRDLLFDILSADDGVMVRLTSPTGEPAVGLAWWSPSRGLWMAVDLATSHAGETLHVWRTAADGSRSPVAIVEIGADGSGRVISTWDEDAVSPSGGPVTLTLTSKRGIWPFVQSPLVLSGTSVFPFPR